MTASPTHRMTRQPDRVTCSCGYDENPQVYGEKPSDEWAAIALADHAERSEIARISLLAVDIGKRNPDAWCPLLDDAPGSWPGRWTTLHHAGWSALLQERIDIDRSDGRNRVMFWMWSGTGDDVDDWSFTGNLPGRAYAEEHARHEVEQQNPFE